MKRFVSQKIRLIPNLREAGARRHLHAHRPTNDFLSQREKAAGRDPPQSWLPQKTNLHTKSAAPYIRRAGLPGSDGFFLPRGRDDRRRLCETFCGGPSRSRSVFCTFRDLPDGSRRSAERRERTRLAGVGQRSPPWRRARQSPPWRSPISLRFLYEAVPPRSKPHQLL